MANNINPLLAFGAAIAGLLFVSRRKATITEFGEAEDTSIRKRKAYNLLKRFRIKKGDKIKFYVHGRGKTKFVGIARSSPFVQGLGVLLFIDVTQKYREQEKMLDSFELLEYNTLLKKWQVFYDSPMFGDTKKRRHIDTKKAFLNCVNLRLYGTKEGDAIWENFLKFKKSHPYPQEAWEEWMEKRMPKKFAGIGDAEKLKIQSVYDNGGKTIDRYTITFYGTNMMLGLSSDPDFSQGVSNWGEGIKGKHLDKKISFKKLPKNIQKHVMRRISDDA